MHSMFNLVALCIGPLSGTRAHITSAFAYTFQAEGK